MIKRLVLRPVELPLLGSLALLLLRLVAGVAFVLHGWPKIQHPTSWMGEGAETPGLFQALAAIAEFLGGIAWAAGLLTRPAAAGILCTMFVAASFHISRGDPFVSQGGGSWELAAVYLAVAALLLVLGAGRLSADAQLTREPRK